MISLPDIQKLLADRTPQLTEDLAQQSARLTRQYFGRAISLYAPLYLSNFCSSHCTYCGFHSHNRIKRIKLTTDEMRQEMGHINATGIQNILLLTGESYNVTPLPYLADAVRVAAEKFQGIALEVHPMNTEDYKELYQAGADGVTVYQETYDRGRYAQVHLAGLKKDYDYRKGTPERAAQAGIRHISMGILLGLADAAEDIHALYTHLRYMEKNFPGVEYSVSFPRLRTIKEQEFARCDVDDITFTKIIALTRLQFPRVGINLSTRESPALRDNLLEIGITKISAGSNTAVGGYSILDEDEQDPQFDIKDERGVADVVAMLKERDFDPVFTDWRAIGNAG